MTTLAAASPFRRLIALVIAIACAAGARSQVFDMGGGGPPEPGAQVKVSATLSQSAAAPGGQVAIAVVLDHQPGWHTWPNQPVLPAELRGLTAIPTRIAVEAPEGVLVGPAQWPAPKEVEVGFGTSPVTIQSYAGKAVAYVPVIVPESAAAGEALDFAVRVSYQACDDTVCMPPTEDVVRLSLPIVGMDAPVERTDAALFGDFDPSVFAAMLSGEAFNDSGAGGAAQTRAVASIPRTFFGITIPSPESAGGLAVLVLLAALGGLILNLTPCVLPVIPIKIMTITQHAGSPGRSLALGVWMALGVTAFWVGIGVPAALVTSFTDPSKVFGIWWVTLGIGAIIAAMGFGIMGAFTINLPKAAYMVNPKADTAWGSFVFGVMTGVLGLPCFGFVAGALLVSVAGQPPAVTMAIFAGLGVGMAAPYLVLSMNPKWVEKVPRTGPASELVKQVMGLLMLAAAAFFIGAGLIALVIDRPWIAKQLHWWAVALLATMAGLWLLVRTIQITKRPGRRVFFGVVGASLAGAATLWAVDVTETAREKHLDRSWVAYSEAGFEKALEAGQVVVLDFTAEWCINCKALKAAVLDVEPVRSAVREPDVVTMTVDLTSASAPGWEKLRALGQTGIPTLAVYGPGVEGGGPIVANAYNSGQVLRWLEEARGGSASLSRTR